MIDVAEYMSNTIRKMMARAYKNVLSNPREAEFVFRMQKQFRKAEQRRKELKETEGLDVPPFLISSIATTCNLHCAGCYARSNGIANDKEDLRKATLTPQQWHDIFTEAAELGIKMGCKIVFLVEYVPTEKGTEHLALTETHVSEMEASVEERRTEFENMIFFSFPGDEKYVGGCLASGRGFVHIGPDGSAEPCPFSPFSDRNVAETGLRQALQSPLFRKIRDANALSWQHTGGCTLWEHRDEVEAFISAPS